MMGGMSRSGKGLDACKGEGVGSNRRRPKSESCREMAMLTIVHWIEDLVDGALRLLWPF